jgi:hypothetical protein
VDQWEVDVKPIAVFAISRIAFGIGALAAPAFVGRALAGAGGAEPDAQAFLRGMGGREIGLGLGTLAALRAGVPVHAWLIAILLGDSSDIAGIAGTWRHLRPEKRVIALATAGGAAAAGAALLATG